MYPKKRTKQDKLREIKEECNLYYEYDDDFIIEHDGIKLNFGLCRYWMVSGVFYETFVKPKQQIRIPNYFLDLYGVDMNKMKRYL